MDKFVSMIRMKWRGRRMQKPIVLSRQAIPDAQTHVLFRKAIRIRQHFAINDTNLSCIFIHFHRGSWEVALAETSTNRKTRIIHPDSIAIENEASRGATVTRRSRRRGAKRQTDSATVSTDALIDALATDSTIEIADDFDLVPRQSKTKTARRGQRKKAAAPTKIEIDVEKNERAAILIESDGVYAWKFPREDESRRRRVRGKGKRTLVVTIDVPQEEDGGGRRGRRGLANWFKGGITDRIRVIIVKFIAGKAVTAAQRYLERNINPGLVEIRGENIANWIAGDRTPKVTLPAGQPARILLMIHGTFSSTKGSFGALAASADGRSFLEDAAQRYDAILAYDHATLGETPQENATAILDSIRKVPIPPGSTVDIIAFSRGGLVARILIERLLGKAGWPLTPEKAVFVGCTNGGTALADQENWKILLDLYTNLAVAANKGLALLGAGISGVIITESIKTLSTFMQAVVDSAVTEEMVPGIAAMSPKNPLVNELNNPAILVDDTKVAYFALGSNFEPSFKRDDTGTSLPAKLVRALADLGVDQLMGEANDLVVNNEAMTQFGAYSRRLAEGIIWDKNATIFHTNYFLQPSVARVIRRWLINDQKELVVDAARGPEKKRVTRPLGAKAGLKAGPLAVGTSAAMRQRRKAKAARKPAAAKSVAPALKPSRDREDEKAPGAVGEIECHFAAEMEKSSPLGETADLTVTVSREKIEEAVGKAFGKAKGIADRRKPIEIEVRARANCTIEGPNRETVRIPEPGKPGYYDFKVKGMRAGIAEIWVDARQGARRLARIILQPEFMATGTISASAVVDSKETIPPLVELRILENSQGTQGPFSLTYLLWAEELGLNETETTREIRQPREPYIGSLYAHLENEWGRDQAFHNFMDQLRAYGAELYIDLVPEAIRKSIWKYRESIGSIRVISDEPFIPWEMLHIVEPNEPLPLRGNKFLAEMGLVRWIANKNLPPAHLTLHNGRARHVIPDYLDERDQLDSLEDERILVRNLFASREVPANSSDVIKLLANGDGFDLLHFACHGSADQESIWDSSLLMAGITDPDDPDQIIDDKLTVSRVRLQAKLMNDEGLRPIVFLNSCQAGKAGRSFSGIGGMGHAFVDAGAGLFVGALWSVGDKTAFVFAKTFYEQLIAGRTVTGAANAARKASKDAEEPTWLAYTIYGHPYARLDIEGA